MAALFIVAKTGKRNTLSSIVEVVNCGVLIQQNTTQQ